MDRGEEEALWYGMPWSWRRSWDCSGKGPYDFFTFPYFSFAGSRSILDIVRRYRK